MRQRILVTVKTYPTLSRKYGETVCTAGIRDDGSWVRLYPVPFRRLDEKEQYSKFDWIELDIAKASSDHRPETYSPTDAKAIRKISHIGTADNWRERRKLVLDKAKVYDRLQPLLKGAKDNTLSLAVLKPAKILDFIWEECERDWDAAKVAAMRNEAAQGELFQDEQWRQTFMVMQKLPYNFSYRFIDADGTESTMQIMDWEAGQLYWNSLKAAKSDEQTALKKVRQKYIDEFTRRDLHLFLGTIRQFHGFSLNPWVIVGVFPIPHDKQMEFSDL